MNARLFHSKLYKSPAFKNKWWFDTEIYSEQTPLLSENIKPFLDKFTLYSNIYETLDDYYAHCQHKEVAPQIVGLDEIDHWICVEKDSTGYIFIDSSGAPAEAYENLIQGLPKRITYQEEGKIRQSPLANSCGLYAAFYCASYSLYNCAYYFWDALAHRVVEYYPITLTEWRKSYKNVNTDYWLHLNDIALYEMYKTMLHQ